MNYPIIALVLCLSLVAQAAYFMHWLNMPAPRSRGTRGTNRTLSPGVVRLLGLIGAVGVLCYAAYDRDAVLFVGQALLMPAFFTLRTPRAHSPQRDG